MDKVYEVCNHCGVKHCCKGLCKEMNEFLIKKVLSTIEQKVAVTHK